jgi:dethiobiotin synthetase
MTRVFFMINLPKAFFVAGTDTDVGKTFIATILTLGLQATYWKPIQSGLTPSTDTEYVRKYTELDQSHFLPERYKLTEPLSPHASAAIDGVDIELDDFVLPLHNKEYLIVEGAGGLMVPVNDRYFIIDLIKRLQLPVLLVARSALGTINHTLLSLEVLRRFDIPILGVVMNGNKNEGNRNAIADYGRVHVIAQIEKMPVISKQRLLECFHRSFSSGTL